MSKITFIGKIPLSDHPEAVRTIKRDMHTRPIPGEVYSTPFLPENTVSGPLDDVLHARGLKRRPSSRYTLPSVTTVSGSVHFHTDYGMGWVALWFTHHKQPKNGSLDGPMATLITPSDSFELHIGGCCVFNADDYHAWMCNGISGMLVEAVSIVDRGRFNSSHASRG
jgi:hypothetical protein